MPTFISVDTKSVSKQAFLDQIETWIKNFNPIKLDFLTKDAYFDETKLHLYLIATKGKLQHIKRNRNARYANKVMI